MGHAGAKHHAWWRLLAVAGPTLLVGAACTSGVDDPEPNSPTDSAPTPTSTTETTTPTSATNATPPAPREITVAMNGDVLLHSGLWETAAQDAARTGRGTMDFRPLLQHIKPLMSGADLAVCHLETPVAAPAGPYTSYPVFSVPPQIIPALADTGYDTCTTSSNHSIDAGFEGLSRTLDDLDQAGIEHTGTSRTARDARRPFITEVDGVQVGIVAATYGTNGIPLPTDQPWSVRLIDVEQIKRLAARTRAAGADVVLVALHWGLEYVHEPSTDQVAVAEALTKSPDIDFVYGHHAHVVQPYEKVNGTWVAYGLGNMVARQETDVEGVYDGNTCRVTFRERPDGSFAVSKLEFIPTKITAYDGVTPMRVLNVPRALKQPRWSSYRDVLEEADADVSQVVLSLGGRRQGVRQGD